MSKVELLYVNGKATLKGAPKGMELSRIMVIQPVSRDGVPIGQQQARIRVKSIDGQFRIMTVDVAYERTEQDGTMH